MGFKDEAGFFWKCSLEEDADGLVSAIDAGTVGILGLTGRGTKSDSSDW